MVDNLSTWRLITCPDNITLFQEGYRLLVCRNERPNLCDFEKAPVALGWRPSTWRTAPWWLVWAEPKRSTERLSLAHKRGFAKMCCLCYYMLVVAASLEFLAAVYSSAEEPPGRKVPWRAPQGVTLATWLEVPDECSQEYFWSAFRLTDWPRALILGSLFGHSEPGCQKRSCRSLRGTFWHGASQHFDRWPAGSQRKSKSTF